MDFNQFVNGLRAMGLPNEQAVYIALAVQFGREHPNFNAQIGSFGIESLNAAIQAVEKRA